MDLGSLNMENIENILSSMSSEDMEMLSGMAQNLFSSMEQKEKKEEKAPPSQINNPFSSFNLDLETIGKIMNVIQKLQSRPADPRCNLLLSLKPMLNEQKQGKIDEAIKIISLLSFLPLLDELRGEGNG